MKTRSALWSSAVVLLCPAFALAAQVETAPVRSIPALNPAVAAFAMNPALTRASWDLPVLPQQSFRVPVLDVAALRAAVLPESAVTIARIQLAKKKDKTPEERPRREPGPDDTGGIDGIGNPTRDDNRGGPDDRSDDGSGDRGGNDVLFSPALRASASFGSLRQLDKSKGSRRTPEEKPAPEPGPDDTNVDGLGNPSRDDNRGGPDDAWDGSGDRGGNQAP